MRLGIARTTYSGYERGTSEPDFTTVEKMANFFEVKLNWLLTGENKDMNEQEEELLLKFSNLSKTDQQVILDLMERLQKE